MEKPTIRELGSLYKEDHPEYSHIPDVEVGQELVIRYPQYLDSIDLEDNDLEALIQDLMDKAERVHGGWFSSWLGKKHSARRSQWYAQLLTESKTIRALALEQDALNETRYQRTQRAVVRDQKEKERDASHNVTLQLNQYAGELAKQGYTLETDQQMKLETHKANTEVEKTRKINELEITKIEQLGEVDRQLDYQRALDQIQANFIIKHFTDHQRVTMLQTQLDQLYEEIDKLQKEQKAGWESKLEDRKATVKALQENQNALRTRLLEADQPKALAGASAESDDPRDPR